MKSVLYSLAFLTLNTALATDLTGSCLAKEMTHSRCASVDIEKLKIERKIALLNSPFGHVRENALLELAEENIAKRPFLKNVLIDALQDNNMGIKHIAVKYIIELQIQEAFPHLIKLLETGDVDELKYSIFLSLYNLNQKNITLDEEVAQYITPSQYITPFLDSEDEDMRERALDLLADMRVPKALPSLLRIIKTTKEDTTLVKTIYALRAIGDASAISAILSKKKHSSERVRIAVITAIGDLKLHAEVPYLESLIKSQPKYSDRAMHALLKIKGESALPLLHFNLQAKNNKPKDFLLKAIGKIKDDSSIPYLIKFVTNTDDYDLQHTALNSLWQISGKDAASVSLPLLQHDNETVRITTLDTFIKYNKNLAVKVLLDLLEHSKPEVRKIAIKALANRNNPDAQPYFIQFLEDEDAGIRESALYGLSKYKDVPITNYAIKMLEDQNKYVVFAAKSTLEKRNLPAIFEDLKPLLEHENAHTRTSARSLLAQAGYTEVLPHILKDLNSKDESVRASAVFNLDDFKSKIGESYLLQSLKDPSEKVQQAAIFALADRENACDYVKYLLPFLKSDNDYTKYIAVQAIKEIGQLASLSDLRTLMKNIKLFETDDETQSAVDIFDSLRYTIKTEDLIILLEDKDPHTQMKAVRALLYRNPKIAIQRLVQLRDSDTSSTEIKSYATKLIRFVKKSADPAFLKSLKITY